MTALTELSNILWRQRRSLEALLYKLEVQQLLLTAGRTRWISTAANDVEDVLTKIRSVELSRAVQAATVAAELGMPHPEPSLKELTEIAPAPWDAILRDHQEAFLAMTAEVDELTKHNKELLNRGYQATREYLAALNGPSGTDIYSARGTAETFGSKSHVLDQVF